MWSLCETGMALKYKVSYQQVRNQTPRTEPERAQIEIEQFKHKLYLAEMENGLLKNWKR